MSIRCVTLRELLVSTALIGSIGLAPNAAWAQSSAPAATDAAQVSEGEIIVTAQRRAERLEDVPASVLAISADALQSAGVTKFQDLALVAPGVQISRSGSYTQPAIRGISTTFAGNGQETNVAVYVDGFYTSDQLSINQDFANIQGVEVLKGAQGTLYGRNATGGAILITTRSPGDALSVDGSISYAPRFEDRQARLFVGSPIANGVKFSVAGYYRKSEGYIRDINGFSPNVVLDPTVYSFGGKAPSVSEAVLLKRSGNSTSPFENWSIRPKLILEPSDALRVTLGYVHNFINDPRAFSYLRMENPLNPAAAYNGYPVATARDTTSLNFQPVNESESDEFNATIELKVADNQTFTSRTAFRKQKDFQAYDLDATPADSGNANVPAAVGTTYIGIQFNDRKTFTQQLDYAGSFGQLEVLAGLFYYDDVFKTPQGFEDIGIGTPTASITDFSTKAWAAYIDATLQIGESLFVTVGGRYSHDEKRLNRVRYAADGTIVASQSAQCYTNVVNPVLDPGCANSSKTTSADAFTPRAVIRYELSPRTNVYASVARGFKAPTINTASPFNRLEPETVTAYEIGFKTASSSFRGEVSAFYYNYKNNQVSALSASTPSITTLIQNSGGAEIYGIDGTLAYQVPETRLNLRAGLSYLHARFTDFGNATNVIVGPTGTNTSVIGSWTGRQLARAPDWSGSVGADYTADLFGGELMASGTLAFSSRYAPQNASYQCTRVSRDASGNDIPFVVGSQGYCASGTNGKTAPGRFEEDGYVVVNAQLGWTDSNKRFTATIYADNLTNERYKIVTSGFAYQTYSIFSEPRTIGMRLGFKY